MDVQKMEADFAMVFTFVFAALGIMIAIVGPAMKRAAVKKRREALLGEALPLGLEAFSIPPEELQEFYPALHNYGRGEIRNIFLHRIDLGAVWLFDYRYTPGSADDRSTVQSNIACLKLQRRIPDFEMVPENFGHKIMHLFGNDIDLPERPKFSKRYLLTAANDEDADAVRLLFRGPVGAFFEEHLGLSLSVTGGRFIFVALQVKPRGLREFVASSEQVARLLVS